MKPTQLIISILAVFLIGCKNEKWNNQQYVDYLTFSDSLLRAKQEVLEAEFKIHDYERWDFYQETGQLVFSDSGVAKVIARFEDVGSVSEKSGTWLWAWGNNSILPANRQKIEEVKMFGEKHGIKKLTEQSWSGDQVDGWEMTSISANVLDAKGAYRAPVGDGLYIYMLLMEISFAQEGK